MLTLKALDQCIRHMFWAHWDGDYVLGEFSDWVQSHSITIKELYTRWPQWDPSGSVRGSGSNQVVGRPVWTSSSRVCRPLSSSGWPDISTHGRGLNFNYPGTGKVEVRHLSPVFGSFRLVLAQQVANMVPWGGTLLSRDPGSLKDWGYRLPLGRSGQIYVLVKQLGRQKPTQQTDRLTLR